MCVCVCEHLAHIYALTLLDAYIVLAFVKLRIVSVDREEVKLRITFSISTYIMCVNIMFVQRPKPRGRCLTSVSMITVITIIGLIIITVLVD